MRRAPVTSADSMTHPRPRRRGIHAARSLTTLLAALVAACAMMPAHAQAPAAGPATGYPPDRLAAPAPAEVQGVDIIDRRGDMLPLDLRLVNDRGETIVLGDLFDGRHPVILQLGYFKCPMLCNLVLNEMVRSMEDLDFTAGKEFRVIAVSVNPEETAELAAVKKAGYLLEYGREGVADGWHFLTGDAASTKALADSVGFGYQFVPSSGEYAHAAALFIITPEGRISRVLYGVRYEPGTLRMSLLEASEGRIGSALDRIILWCHVFDPDAGSYVLFAFRVMQIGGAVTVVLLGGTLFLLWVRDLRSRRRSVRPAPTA